MKVACKFEPCGAMHEARLNGGIWKPEYCKECIKCKVWKSYRNQQKRLKELAGEKGEL